MQPFRSHLPYALLLGLGASLGAAPVVVAVESPASVMVLTRDPSPGNGSICLNEREVFQPKAVGSIDDGAEEGRRIELVRKTVCADLSRASCFEAGICR